jgi:hypothetical protein
VQPLRGEARGTSAELVPPALQESLEALHVDRIVVHRKRIAPAAPHDSLGAERLPQSRDVRAQCRLRAWRQVALPQLLGQPVGRHRTRGRDGEQPRASALRRTEPASGTRLLRRAHRVVESVDAVVQLVERLRGVLLERAQRAPQRCFARTPALVTGGRE